MSWRSLIISQPARLSLNKQQLLVEQKDAISVPLEDIAVMVIESREVLLTAPLLSALAEYGVTLLTCSDSHLPNGQWLSLLPHSRQTKIVRHQVAMSEPLKKRLWQKIVQSKINNQAEHLDYLNLADDAEYLRRLASHVKSGDSENYESQAALRYFNVLFGRHFSRRYAFTVNDLLNYGYSIIRAAIGRSLVSYGFLPVFGLHHNNEQNAFNLADDMIEPWRPWVDLAITTWFADDCDDFQRERRALTPKDKQRLVSLLHHQATIQGDKTTLLSAMSRSIASLQTAMLNRQVNALQLPALCPLIWHEYE